jgi:hypothetical protein
VVHTVFSPFLVSVDDDLRVTVGTKLVPFGFEMALEILEIVYLAIEHDDDGPVLVKYRLMSAPEIYDAEAAHSQGHRVIDKQPLIVRATMMHLPQHAMHDALRRFRICAAYYSADSAHLWLFRSMQEGRTLMKDRAMMSITTHGLYARASSRPGNGYDCYD